jgi:Family of unknown function (DUF6326)
VRSTETGASLLEDAKVPVKLKLSALWAALTFLYAYGDIFAYLRSGYIDDVMGGEVSGFEIDQVFLLAISIYVAVPAVMVFLALLLNPGLSRWLNVVVGLVYAVTIPVDHRRGLRLLRLPQPPGVRDRAADRAERVEVAVCRSARYAAARASRRLNRSIRSPRTAVTRLPVYAG